MKRFLLKANLIIFLRSIVLSIGSSIWLTSIINIVFRMIGKELTLLPLIIISSILFLISLILFFIYLKLDGKKLSKILDRDFNLPQTVETMIEFEEFEIPMANLQRKAAIEKLNSLKLKDFKIKVHVIDIFIMLWGICLLIFSFIIPVNKNNDLENNVSNNEESMSEDLQESEEIESSNQEEESNDSNNSGEMTSEDENGEFSSVVQEKIDEAESTKNDSSMSKEDKLEKINQIKQEVSEITKDNSEENQRAQETLNSIKEEIENSDKEEDSSEGSGNSGEGAGAGSGETKYSAHDKIYDPKTGTYVEYGDIIDEYVQAALNSNLTDEELQALISAYFSSLYNEGYFNIEEEE